MMLEPELDRLYCLLQEVVTSIPPIDALGTEIKKFDSKTITLIAWFHLSKKLDS